MRTYRQFLRSGITTRRLWVIRTLRVAIIRRVIAGLFTSVGRMSTSCCCDVSSSFSANADTVVAAAAAAAMFVVDDVQVFAFADVLGEQIVPALCDLKYKRPSKYDKTIRQYRKVIFRNMGAMFWDWKYVQHHYHTAILSAYAPIIGRYFFMSLFFSRVLYLLL